MILADAARHVAATIKQRFGRNQAEALHRLRQSFESELEPDIRGAARRRRLNQCPPSTTSLPFGSIACRRHVGRSVILLWAQHSRDAQPVASKCRSDATQL